MNHCFNTPLLSYVKNPKQKFLNIVEIPIFLLVPELKNRL